CKEPSGWIPRPDNGLGNYGNVELGNYVGVKPLQLGNYLGADSARGDGRLEKAEKDWVIGYGAACGAHQATIDALMAYEANEDVVEILERNMPVATTWARIVVYDAIRASCADHDYDDGERAAVRRIAAQLGLGEDVVSALEDGYGEEQRFRRGRIELVFGQDVPYQPSS
ncbi:MAG: hypothetical protein M3083_01060, partial [Actinomycetota bacterium]|nr:hypothetical protein [Actinomycetota bacterium]